MVIATGNLKSREERRYFCTKMTKMARMTLSPRIARMRSVEVVLIVDVPSLAACEAKRWTSEPQGQDVQK